MVTITKIHDTFAATELSDLYFDNFVLVYYTAFGKKRDPGRKESSLHY